MGVQTTEALGGSIEVSRHDPIWEANSFPKIYVLLWSTFAADESFQICTKAPFHAEREIPLWNMQFLDFREERRRLFIRNAHQHLLTLVKIPISLKLFKGETLKYGIDDYGDRTSISYETECIG